MAEPLMTYADNPYNSPIRRWITDYLIKEFPLAKVYRSDSDNDKECQVFETWTQTTQRKEKADKFGYYYLPDVWSGKKTFSTCTSFIAILVTRIREYGGLMPKKGMPKPRVFQTFDLESNGPSFHLYPSSDSSPDVGDIFVYGRKLHMEHVGVILNSDGNIWETIEAGGGVIGKYQSIARTSWHTPEYPRLYGWLNVDEYFGTWSNAKYD